VANIADIIRHIVSTVGNDANNVAMLERFGPHWREDIDFQRATRASTLRSNEMTEARGRLTLADQLSNLIGPQVGQVEALRDAPPLNFQGEGGVGYEATMPPPAEPDFAAMMPRGTVEAAGMTPDSIVGLARGKEALRQEEGKRALAILKGDQSLAAINARNAGAEGRDARNNAFRQSLEEFKQKGRGDIVEQTARLRRWLEEYRQGQISGRQDRSIDSSEARFYDRLDQSAQQWDQSMDLREMSARRQTLSAELNRNADLTPEGRAQVTFELGVINGRLANMGLLRDGAVTPNGASTDAPDGSTTIPSWVSAIVAKGPAATPAERARVARWRASVGR